MKEHKPSLGIRVLSGYIAGFFWLAPVAALADEALVEAPSDRLPPGSLTAGALYTEDYWEGIGDVLAPLYFDDQGLLFVNPRLSRTDNSATEFNAGVGYRRLIRDRQAIAGGNLYYDYRDTSAGAQFHQFGAGLEYLSRRLDLRANIYVPTETRQKVNEFTKTEESTSHSTSREIHADYNDPYATGHSVLQDFNLASLTQTRTTTMTTTRFYEQYEIAFWGWDAEIGSELPLPVLEDYVRVKPFAGFVHYYGRSGVSDIESFRGRLEVHIRPAFFIDAVYLSDDKLTGGNFTLGAYVSLPFEIGNIARGRNPFAGAAERWHAGNRNDMVWRLADMVKRDPQIRSGIAEPEERVERAATTATTTTSTRTEDLGSGTAVILADVTFVNNENAGNPAQDGTAENPYDSVQEGVDNANSPVWVFTGNAPYEENVEVREGVQLYGDGTIIQALGGKTWGGGTHPVLLANAAAPTVTILGNDTAVSGFDIRHSGAAGGPLNDPVSWDDVTYAGIYGSQVSHLQINDNIMTDGSLDYGIYIANGSGSIDLVGSFLRNTIRNVSEDGLKVIGWDGADVFDVKVSGDYSFNRNGIILETDGYEQASASLQDIAVNGNALHGLYAYLTAERSSQMSVQDVVAGGNSIGVFAVAVTEGDAGEAALEIANVNADGNLEYGLLAGAGALFHPMGGDARLTMQNISANGNQEGGVLIEVWTQGQDALASLTADGVEANGNLWDGWRSWVESDNGSSEARLANITAMDNGRSGIDTVDIASGGTAGSSVIEMNNITATGNQDRGIRLISAEANDGLASISLNGVTVSGNDPYGIDYITASSFGHDAGAVISLENVTANDNGRSGIFEITAQTAGDRSDATVLVDGVTANQNGHYGLEYIQAFTAGLNANATVSVQNTEASGNLNDAGIYQVSSQLNGTGGNANVLLDGIVAENNGGDGIARVEVLTSNGSDINVLLTDITVQNNANNGLGIVSAEAYGPGGDTTVSLVDVDAIGNGSDGIQEIRATAEIGNVVMMLDEIIARLNGTFGIQNVLARADGPGADAALTFTDSDLTGNTAGASNSIQVQAPGIGGTTSYFEDNVQQ